MRYTEAATRRCSVKKGVLKNFAKFTGKHLCSSLFLNKVAGLRPVTLFKKRLWHRCFPVNFAKFLGTPLLQNTYGWMLLGIELLVSYLRSWAVNINAKVQIWECKFNQLFVNFILGNIICRNQRFSIWYSEAALKRYS